MSRRSPINGGNGRVLRSHQTHVRRSPRFLPRKSDETINTSKSVLRKKPRKPSPKESPLQSPPLPSGPEEAPSKRGDSCSGSSKKKSWRPPRAPDGPHESINKNDGSRLPRMSARLIGKSLELKEVDGADKDTSLPPIPEEKTSGNKTQNGSCRKRSRPIASVSSSQCPRRSPRLASIYAKEVAILDATTERGRGGEPRQSTRSKIPAKDKGRSEETINQVDPVKVGTKSVRMKKGGGRSKKARKVDGNCEEEAVAERAATEEHCKLLGWKKEGEKACNGKAAIGWREKEDCVGLGEWTEEQKAALRRAYLCAKPSPHFWKKVSKMVPGKSAQECFDKVHENFATPPEPQPRSRKCKINLSPISHFNLPGSKTTQLAETKTRRLKSTNKKSLLALKTARHYLRKHCEADQNQEADFFSVIETSPNALLLDLPDIEIPATLNGPRKYSERSSSAHKSLLSRFKPPTLVKHVSPEVLKQIKNMALHERYIDKLHRREARRKQDAKSSRSVRSINRKSNCQLKTNVKDARSALISEARDFISHFQKMQASALENLEGFSNDDYHSSTDDSALADDDE